MNFIRNMNIKVRFTISYIIIIFTLIFGSSTLLVNMYNNILKVTNELNEQNHRFITNNIINKLVENHSFILSFNDIENISQITSTDNLYTLSELGAANQLRKLFLKPQFSKNNARFYVYIKQTDCIISGAGTFKSKQFFDYLNLDYNIDYRDWLDAMCSVDKINEYRNIGKDGKYIIFSSYLNKMVKLPGDVYFSGLMKSSDMFGYDEKNDWFLNSASYIFNFNGNVVLKFNEKSDKLPEINTIDRALSMSDKYFILNSTVTSNDTEWRVVTLEDKDLALKSVNKVRNTTIIFFTAVLAISILLAKFFARTNYRPIQHLSSMFTDGNARDEFENIRRGIAALTDENTENKLKIRMMNDEVKNMFILRILNGNFSSDFLKSAAEYSITFPFGHFFVILISDYEDGIADRLKLDSGGDGCRFFAVKQGEDAAVIVNTDLDYDALSAILQKGICSGGGKYVYVSVRHDTVDEIPICYVEAMECKAQYEGFKKQQHIYQYAPARYLSDIYTLLNEQMICNCLRTGNFTNIKKMLDNIFVELRKLHGVERSLLFTDLICMASKTVYVIDLSDHPDLEARFSFSHLKLFENSIDTLETELNDLYMLTCKISAKYFAEKQNELQVRRIMACVWENYSDPNMSLSSVSEELGMSSRRLTTIFKDSKGMTIPEYISDFRIEKAIALFGEDMSISDISDSVGFGNVRTFERLFKAKYGITPARYRAQNKFR